MAAQDYLNEEPTIQNWPWCFMEPKHYRDMNYFDRIGVDPSAPPPAILARITLLNSRLCWHFKVASENPDALVRDCQLIHPDSLKEYQSLLEEAAETLTDTIKKKRYKEKILKKRQERKKRAAGEIEEPAPAKRIQLSTEEYLAQARASIPEEVKAAGDVSQFGSAQTGAVFIQQACDKMVQEAREERKAAWQKKTAKAKEPSAKNPNTREARAKYWMITFHNPQKHFQSFSDHLNEEMEDQAAEPYKKMLAWFHKNLKSEYLTGQLESGEEGTPHFQLLFYFNRKIRSTTFANLKLWNGMVLKEAIALPIENQDSIYWHNEKVKDIDGSWYYCRKDETRVCGPWEFGVKPFSNTNADWDHAREMAKQGRFDEIPSQLYIRYRRAFKDIFTENQSPPADIPKLPGEWWVGPSQAGKSSTFRKENPIFYSKMCNKWWDGYQFEEVVLIEDFKPEHVPYMQHFLDIWCDHYSFPAECKGGFIGKRIRPTRIVVTSRYTIDELWSKKNKSLAVVDLSQKASIMRRFPVVRRFGDPLWRAYQDDDQF